MALALALPNPDGFQRQMLAAFRAGKDTQEIAREFKVREAVAYNALHRAPPRSRSRTHFARHTPRQPIRGAS